MQFIVFLTQQQAKQSDAFLATVAQAPYQEDHKKMEVKAVKENYFIVIRGKSRKGFCRGCIGRAEVETEHGEITGLLYGGGVNAGPPKNGGVVRREDTYPLSHHQAQLLLYVSSTSKRLELLCNAQLFTAICELTQDDLVVVRHKKGYQPGLVKNLMQIGKKENRDDLQMLCFEVEFLVGGCCVLGKTNVHH